MSFMESPNLQDRIKAFEGNCRKAGLRLTQQRLDIYRELASRDDHPSAEDIYAEVSSRMPTISLDTVYRTLATLELNGLIFRVHAFDDRARFDANLSPHQHVVCTGCESVKDLQWQAFEVMKLPTETKEWGHVETKRVVLRGICKKCLEKKEKKRGGL